MIYLWVDESDKHGSFYSNFYGGILIHSSRYNHVVNVLTQAINEELRRDGSKVKISVLCPGPVETNFNNVANVRFTTKGLNARDVARYAFDKARQGKIIIIPGFLMKTVKFFEHFLPENLLTRISYNVQSKKEGK